MGRARFDVNNIHSLIAVSNADGATPIELWADPTTHGLILSGSGSDGAIVDGVSSAIKATVFDYANSNPLGVVLRDTNGDYVSVGGGTQYTEDVAAAADPVGTAVNLIRADALAAVTTTDGDNVAARGTNKGELYVKHVDSIPVTGTFWQATQPVSGTVTANMGTVTADPFGANADASSATGSISAKLRFIASTGIPITGTVTVAAHAVTNAGTFVVQENGAALTALQLLDDTVATLGTTTYTEATTKANVIGAVRRDADTSLVDTTNEIAPLQVDANGRLKVEAFSGETLPVSGTVTINAIPAGTNNIGDVDVLTVPADPFGVNADAASATGSISAKLRFIAATGIPITGTVTVGSHAVTNAGTFAVQAAGDVAHDAADSGAPQKVGGQARTTNPAAVADADRTNFIADKLGKQVVVGSIRELKGRQVTTITSSTAEATIVTAAASTFHDLYGLVLSNTSATATEVTVRDATAGGTISSFMVPAGETRGFMLTESAAWPQATVNNNWTATCGTSVASLKVTALYIKNI